MHYNRHPKRYAYWCKLSNYHLALQSVLFIRWYWKSPERYLKLLLIKPFHKAKPFLKSWSTIS